MKDWIALWRILWVSGKPCIEVKCVSGVCKCISLAWLGSSTWWPGYYVYCPACLVRLSDSKKYLVQNLVLHRCLIFVKCLCYTKQEECYCHLPGLKSHIRAVWFKRAEILSTISRFIIRALHLDLKLLFHRDLLRQLNPVCRELMLPKENMFSNYCISV